MACLAVWYFSASSHKCHDFWEKVIEHKMCAFIFPTTFVRNISHCKKNSGTYYCKYESRQNHPVALLNCYKSNPREYNTQTLYICLYYFLLYVSVVHSTIISRRHKYVGRSNINWPLSVATSEWARLGNDLVRRCCGVWGPSSPRRQTLPSPQLVEIKISDREVPVTIAQRVVI